MISGNPSPTVDSGKLRVVIAGASGLIGSALVPALRAAGHDVRRLVRHGPVAAPDEIYWNPATGELDISRIEKADAIINLAGENIGAGRWTAARRALIFQSRVDATRTLVKTIATLPQKPAVFLSASAVGIYGDRGDETLTENSVMGQGFLPEVCLAWETHAEGAARQGVRTALLRFGVVLARDGGALAKMLPLFRLGLGGRLGSGRQWMSWIALDDVIGVVQHALADVRCTGPLNVVAPAPVTNAEFAALLGRVLHRPAFLPAPAWALRIALGKMADEALLASVRAVPEKLLQVGYRFHHADLEAALDAVLRREPRSRKL